MADGCGQGAIVHDFKVDEARPAGEGIIKNVTHGGIAVGPAAVVEIADHVMGAAELVAGDAEHVGGQGLVEQMRPETVAWETVDTDAVGAEGFSVVLGVQEAIAADFPALPGLGIGAERNGDVAPAEEPVGHGQDAPTEGVPAFGDQSGLDIDFVEANAADDGAAKAVPGRALRWW